MSRWTRQEDRILVEAIEEDGKSYGDAASLLGRSRSACIGRGFRLALRSGICRHWTADEDALIAREYAGRQTAAEIAAKLGRSSRAVEHRSWQLRNRPAASPGRGARERTCLRCGSAFPSWGAGNRICGRCAGGSEFVEHALHV